jgi:hypothetical protein
LCVPYAHSPVITQLTLIPRLPNMQQCKKRKKHKKLCFWVAALAQR